MAPEKTEIAYQVCVPLDVEDVELVKQGKQRKQGHKCCGGCCDMRRAVIIVNTINIVLIVIGTIMLIIAHNSNVHLEKIYNDDEVKSQVETAMAAVQKMPLGALIAFEILQIVVYAAGIVGALRYNIYLVGVSMAGYCFAIAVNLMTLNIFGLICPAFFAYPHLFFIQEVRKGIMSKENYYNEEMSCCCV
jgi:hypothetical protein